MRHTVLTAQSVYLVIHMVVSGKNFVTLRIVFGCCAVKGSGIRGALQTTEVFRQ